MEVRPGDRAVDVQGVQLSVRGFVAEVAPAAGARGAAAPGERGAVSARSLADRLAERLAAAPDTAFRVGDDIEVHGEPLGTRDAGEAVATASVPSEPGRVPLLLTEDDDGMLSWLLPDDHEAFVTGERGATRGAPTPPAQATFTIPMGPAAAETGERGVLSFAFKKVFRVVSAALFDPLLAQAGRRLAEWAERSRQPRLRWFGPDDHLEAAVDALGLADLERCAGGPTLLFVHGTNAQSHSGFAGIPRDVLEHFWRAYDGRVIAYDHPTLSVDPEANARWLAAQVPPGVSLTADVVAHSRGGLVARELAERPPATGLHLRSITFVGTPNAGTPLCQPAHLTSYVDLLTNLLSVLPDNGITDALDGIVSVVSHLARKAYEGIPGAMAMNPDGEYLRARRAEAPPAGCVYRGIVADFEPGPEAGWKRRARDLVVDKVFGGEANDLIVPTASVWAGGLVPEQVLCGRTAYVDHSTYWEDSDTLEALGRWLTGAPPAGAAPSTPPATPPPAAPSPAAPAAPMAPPAAPLAARDIGSPGEPAAPSTPVPSAAPPPLVVEVVHGSLEHARYPVVVGHQAGAMLSGAEACVDGRFGGVLSRRQFLRLYPDALGAVLEVPPGPDPRPPGAIVVGLGPVQDLTAATLVHAATQAALARLASAADDRVAGRRRPDVASDAGERIGLSCVLLGTATPSTISVPAAARAVVEGVLRANRLVLSQSAATAGPTPAITHLELIELQEDRAEIAARTLIQGETLLRRLAYGDGSSAPPVRCLPEVRRGEGGRPAARPDDNRAITWRTITVHRSAEPWDRGTLPGAPAADPSIAVLEFRLIGDIAGVPQVHHPVDEGLVGPLLAQASRRHRPDDQVHNTLFELLLPGELKAEVATGANVQLVLDPAVAAYPWEMLAARLDSGPARPLCVDAGLLRQLDLGGHRWPRLRRPSGNHAIVIGNPPAGPSFASLPGAADEAIAVADLLTARGYTVTRLLFDAQSRPVPAPAGVDDPLADVPPDRYWEVILNELYRREYRIAHLAMHGVYDEARPSRSGAVIGPDRFLTAPVFRSLRAVPDLVFFNCCHLAKVDAAGAQLPGDRRLVAASVATELMAGGVRAVVAAGWAVNDRDAVTFATSLYERLLDGVPYGDATRDARVLIYLGDGDAAAPKPRSSTWGAYQCYGDPGFRLTLGSTAHSTDDPAALLLRSDVERRLGELAAEAGDVRTRDDRREVRQRLQGRLDEIEGLIANRQQADRRWATPRLLVALADAQAAVGDLAGAIHSLQDAIEGSSSAYPLAAVEQLANLEVRQAQKLVRRGELDVLTLFEQTDRLLLPLLQIQRTPERLALLGSARKKRAATLYGRRCEGSTDPAQEADLTEAREAYRAAAALSKAAYQTLLDEQLSFLLGDAGPSALAPAPSPVHDRATPEFEVYWDRVATADRLLTTLLEEGHVADSFDELRQAYEVVFAGRSTWKERDSTIDHLWDLSRLHCDATEADALMRLWTELGSSWQGEP